MHKKRLSMETISQMQSRAYGYKKLLSDKKEYTDMLNLKGALKIKLYKKLTSIRVKLLVIDFQRNIILNLLSTAI